MISVGEGSGVHVDASGHDLAGLRQLVDPAVRRTNRPIAALSRFVTEVQVGDEVAVFIQDGRVLVVGEITGGYQFVPLDDGIGQHRRRVRWNQLIPRTAVEPVFALQDVRPLFRVVTTNDRPSAWVSSFQLSGTQVE